MVVSSKFEKYFHESFDELTDNLNDLINSSVRDSYVISYIRCVNILSDIIYYRLYLEGFDDE